MNTEETKILNGATAASGRMELQEGATLQSGKYKIEKVLGQGGFGITYLAEQTSLQKTVAIKEFFFKEYCVRCTDSSVALTNPNNSDMLNRFLMKFEKEARTISNLDNPNIISIHDTFKENGTAYYVMDYIEGESLEAMIKRVGALKGYKAIEYFKQIAGALSYIHKRKINHLDVKPANIMIRKSDDKAILIDFGLSKQYNARGGQTSTTPVGISHGYAPIEQYNPNGVETFSPQTDIYSLGATLFKMVTGTTPPSSLEISNNGFPSLKNIDQSTADIIKSCMAVKKADRVQNADLLLSGDNIIEAMWESTPDGKEYKLWCCNVGRISWWDFLILYIMLPSLIVLVIMLLLIMSMPVTPDPYKFFLLFFLLYGVISPFIFWGVSVYYSRKYKRKHEQFLKKSSASNVTNEGKTNLSASKINEKSHSILESAHMQDNNKTAENEKSKRISESSKIVTQNKTGLTSVEKEAVIEILTDKLGIDRSEIHNDAEFVNDLDVDSLDAIMLIMELEDKFGIIIHDEDAEKIRTVGDLFDYLSPLLSSKNGISEIPKNLN